MITIEYQKFGCPEVITLKMREQDYAWWLIEHENSISFIKVFRTDE